ncbi:hypothetical protein F3Y22_tig00013808pilonHSYRG00020 [Hibiscus syriacus]|uniref:Uncharacterized protein n=1 Tax=Hibiscus syriacus TaxID=106335 RepID=A0A6A3C618_HIBSY|nr:hypothetical protein F3Y22_tig00013808pilonHSYRG00020 [Hibiscus syriacus]
MIRDRDFGRDIAVSLPSELPATAAIASVTTVIVPAMVAITASIAEERIKKWGGDVDNEEENLLQR